jgi:HTH-type transcriptional regulator, sugar sensing transcriptional regulator
MRMDLRKTLERLHFTTNETKVYLTLLKLGSSYAGKLSKDANLDRSSTYNALKMLLERGIVSYVVTAKKKLFSAADPNKILDYYKEREEIAKSIIPDLRALHKETKDTENVTIFQGYKGVKTILQDILNTCKASDECLVMGSEGQFSSRMPSFCRIFRARKENKKIKSRMLIREGREKNNRGKYTKYRKIKSDVISPVTTNIYKDKVALIIWSDKPEAVMIENKIVAATYKSYFNFMWSMAKDL